MPVEGYSVVYDRVLLGLILGAAVALFAYRLFVLLRLVAAGRADVRWDRFWTRLALALWYVFGQARIFESRLAGAAHFVIFYGFLVICLSTLNVIWRGFFGQSFLSSITDSLYFVGVVDILAVLVIVAVLVGGYRRYVLHPPEVWNSRGALAILALIFLLMITLLTMEASEHLLDMSSTAPPVAVRLSAAFSNLDRSGLAAVQIASYWLHIVLLAGFLAYIPHSKHMHLLVCPFNQFLRSLRPKGALRTVDIDSPSPIGVGEFNQFTWKQLLDLFACTECGRCLTYCPAYVSGQPLSPRQIILDLKESLLRRENGGGHSNPKAIAVAASGAGDAEVSRAVDRHAIWACTTCRACQERCPASIEHLDKIVDIRRFFLDNEGASPTLGKALEGLALLGNPQQLPPGERALGVQKLGVPYVGSTLDIEIVYWLGCSSGYDPKGQEIGTAVAKILKTAGVKVAVLGPDERCCGDLARRSGEEGLFQELAQHNVETLSRLRVSKLLTSCPHCYNTLKNEYPQFGARFSVVHHTDFILKLLRAKRIELRRPLAQRVTYHDPCYLGRHNGVYDSPRQILDLVCGARLIEMPRTRRKALCCGGGGGQLYHEATSGTRVNRLRFAEAEQLSASVIATACPSCKIMLDDAARYDGGPQKLQVKDIAELVCEAIPV